MADALNIPKSTLFDMFQRDNIIRQVSIALKPSLTDYNKWLRAMYAFDRRTTYNNANDKYSFAPNYDEAHVNKKWFFLTEMSQKGYLTQQEDPKERYIRKKQH
jgi:hypothetical protein